MRAFAVWLLAAACGGSAAPTPSAPVKGIDVGDLDRSADPCTDFYQFAVGGWNAAHPIPAAQPKWSRRTEARERERRQLRGVLEDLARRSNWPAGSREQMLGDFYASCVAPPPGLAPLTPLLAELAAAEAPRVMVRLAELAIPAPLAAIGAMDLHTPARFITNIVVGDFDRDRYATTDARAAYRDRIAHALGSDGIADGVVELEARFAAKALPSAAANDPAATDHPMTLAQLKELAPHVAWSDLLDPSAAINVAEPGFVQEVDRALADTPPNIWRAYAAWRVIEPVQTFRHRIRW